MKFGLERVAAGEVDPIGGRRFGLLANMGSIDRDFRYSWDILATHYPGQLRAVFSPQHGLWGEQQANMVESGHERLRHLDLPVFSLYADRREPAEEMLADLDLFVIDLQDVGTRVYTFVWTCLNCLRVCGRKGMPVVVLDRVNPIGGAWAEGPLLDLEFASFVGLGPIPMRHGLSLGELLRLLVAEFEIDVELTVVPAEGWSRGLLWPEMRRTWIGPSPNVPRWEGVLTYPGQVLLEGTNLSEGRGTTTPFEWIGAPFLDGDRLAAEMNELDLPGVRCVPARFIPTFDKWKGKTCQGIAFRVTDPYAFRPYRTAVTALALCWRASPESCAWIAPPYEYEAEKMPIDIIDGGSRLRAGFSAIREGSDISEIVSELVALDEQAWWERAAAHLLYPA